MDMMKTILAVTILAAVALFMAGCTSVTGQNTPDETVQQSIPTNLHEATFQIEGMTCVSCAAGVEYQFKQVNGVIEAAVDYKDGKGTVVFDADRIDADTIAQASDVYPAKVVSDEPI